MSDDPKPYTYADLLEQLAQLTPAQLAHPVIWIGDERGGKIATLYVTPEELVDLDYGAEPMSTYIGPDGELTPAGQELNLSVDEIRAQRTAVVGQPFLEEV